MAGARIEILVEPFKENQPGPHVHAVVNALSDHGLDPDMGPFATTAAGDVAAVADAVRAAIMDGVAAGATALQFRVEASGG